MVTPLLIGPGGGDAGRRGAATALIIVAIASAPGAGGDASDNAVRSAADWRVAAILGQRSIVC
jgi:hypothetical protein